MRPDAPRILRGFFGYQYEPLFLTRTELLYGVNESFSYASADLSRLIKSAINIEFVPHQIQSSNVVLTKILEQIDTADFCIFDLSENNANVCIEFGYALGLGKPVIVQQDKRQDLLVLPSDIHGVALFRYDHSTLQAGLANQIVSLLRDRVVDPGFGKDVKKQLASFWGLDRQAQIHLVCPEIPRDRRSPYADRGTRDYLRLAKYADIDTLFYLRAFLAKEFPTAAISEFTSEDLPEQAYDGCMFVIGGPAWNTVADRYMKALRTPWKYGDGGPGNDDYMIKDGDPAKLVPTLTPGGDIVSDVALFARLPNPSGGACPIFFISGIRTLGVLAAAKLFIDPGQGVANALHTLKHIGDHDHFLMVAKAPIINGFAATPRLYSGDDLIDLLLYNPSNQQYTSIKNTP